MTHTTQTIAHGNAIGAARDYHYNTARGSGALRIYHTVSAENNSRCQKGGGQGWLMGCCMSKNDSGANVMNLVL
jgi:hypothetical protein